MHKSCIVLAMFCIQNRCSRLNCIILHGKYNHARSSSKLSFPPYYDWNLSYPIQKLLHGRGYASRIVKKYKLKQMKQMSCLITKKDLSLWLTVSTSKFSSSLMLKRLSSSRKIPSHRPRSSLHYLQIPKSFSSSDISYVHSWNINWKSIEDNYQDTQHTNPGHSIFPTYSGTSHAKIRGKIRHDLC